MKPVSRVSPPRSRAKGYLHRIAKIWFHIGEPLVDDLSIRFAYNQNVNVTDGPFASYPLVARRPRTEDESLLHSVNLTKHAS